MSLAAGWIVDVCDDDVVVVDCGGALSHFIVIRP